MDADKDNKLDDLNFESYEKKAFQMNLSELEEENKQKESEKAKEQDKQSEKESSQDKVDKKLEKAKRQYKLKARYIKTPDEIKVPMNTSELVVITKAKDLISYIFRVTENSPKKFRFTFIGKLQSLSLDYVENLIRANEVLLKKDDEVSNQKRYAYQKQAFVTLKLLEYFAMLSYENRCILLKQYIQIAKKGNDCKITLANWIKSDKNRVSTKGDK